MESEISNNTEIESKKRIYHFGEKIRSVREKKHLTLKTVALQAGVSESLVSQIERNRVSPAIDTLLSLANVLDINLEYLFEEYNRRRPVSIIRSGERRTINEEDIMFEEVSAPAEKDGQNTLESYMITIPPKSRTHRGSYGHLGKEIGLILEGSGILHYENERYELDCGDSVTFSAGAPHTLENTGDVPLKAVWTVTPAQKFLG